MSNDDDSCLILSGVTGNVMQLLVEALYKGTVTLSGKTQLKQFENALTCLNSFGILLNLRPVVYFDEKAETDVKNANETLTVESIDQFLEEEFDDAELSEEKEQTDDDVELNLEEDDDDSEDTSEKELDEDDVEELLKDDDEEVTEDDLLKEERPKRGRKKKVEKVEEEPKRKRGRPRKEESNEETKEAEDLPLSSKRPKRMPRKQQLEIKKEIKEDEEEPAQEEEKTPAGGKKRSRNEPSEVSEEESPKRRRRTDKSGLKDEAKKPNFDNVTPENLNEKVKEGQKIFIEWLQDEGFLRKAPPPCSVKDCQSTLRLETDKEDIDSIVWKCPIKKCQATVSVRDGSVFGRVKKHTDSLSWIIKIILCWSDNTSLGECQQLTGADVDKIFFWYDECRDYFGTL